ncbi:MAG: hypothetical protein FWC20_07615 [Oscillospiraceae bacterium]|nr:hypothetical protein [Oscillospiraceae bacterium]MCL2279256.1 hypothetical protein [Oscillospiraceae bacterium]
MEKVLRKLVIHKRLVQKNSEVGRVSVDYRCFGEIDGFEIKQCHNKMDIWDDSIKGQKRRFRDLGYHGQSFYMARRENKSDRKDSEFWSEPESGQPHVLLVSFIRISGSENESDWMGVIREIERKHSGVMGYCSLEQSDFILFIRSKTYAECDALIKNILNKTLVEDVPDVTYSYSIPAVKADVFAKNKRIAQYNELLDKVEILIYAKSNGSSSKNTLEFVDELRKCVKCRGGVSEASLSFGNYDMRVVINGIAMHDLLSLHKKGNLLCHTNECYKRTVYNCITKIHILEKKPQEEDYGKMQRKYKPCVHNGKGCEVGKGQYEQREKGFLSHLKNLAEHRGDLKKWKLR